MKKLRILLITLILILGTVFFNQVYAVNLRAQQNRPFSDDDSRDEVGVGHYTYRFLKRTNRF